MQVCPTASLGSGVLRGAVSQVHTATHSPQEHYLSTHPAWTTLDNTAHSRTDRTGLQCPLPLPCRRTVREECCVRWNAQRGVRGSTHWLRTGPKRVQHCV